MKLPALHWQIACALVLAFVAGVSIGDVAWFTAACKFVGTLFLNALKMLIVPLIVSSIIAALLGMPTGVSLGRIGLRTGVLFVVTTLLAVLTSLALVNLVQPGIVDGKPGAEVFGLAENTAELLDKVQGRGMGDITGIFLRAIPTNVVDAAAKADMLALIVFAILFGWFALRLPANLKSGQQTFWSGVYETMILITDWVMKFAPIGVFALVAGTFATAKLEALQSLALFAAVVLAGLAIQVIVWLSLMLKLVGGISPVAHLRAMIDVLITAFSTASSAATLPVSFECVRENAKVSPTVSGFVLPLGATVNMNGTALYECAAAMFIAQAYGLHLTFATQFIVASLALLTSIGVAGVPSASLVAIVVILSAIGLPLEAVGLIMAVDRLLDMCRTAVNVYGDTVTTVLVARLEGEDGVYGLPSSKTKRAPLAG